MRVTVFGATGDQGSAQVHALIRAGHQPVAVSRSAGPWSVDGIALETVWAHFADSRSLAQAVEGSQAVFLNLPSTSFQVAAPLVAAAETIALAAARSPSTRALIFNTSLPVPRDKRGFAAQDARHEMRRRIFDAETVRLPELTRKLSQAWGRPLTHQSQSVEDFCQPMRQAFDGKSSLAVDSMMHELQRIYTWYNTAPERPFSVDMTSVLRELPVRLTPIGEWAARQVLPAMAGPADQPGWTVCTTSSWSADAPRR